MFHFVPRFPDNNGLKKKNYEFHVNVQLTESGY
jgi:hypothetical protein